MGDYTETIDVQRALSLFIKLARCHNAVSERARRNISQHGFSVSEFAVLELLYHKGPAPLGEIADRVLLTTGSMTYVIDQLVKSGVVERVACPRDRRRWFAALTPMGQDRIAAAFPDHAREILETMAALSPAEQETLGDLLRKLGVETARGQPGSPADAASKKLAPRRETAELEATCLAQADTP